MSSKGVAPHRSHKLTMNYEQRWQERAMRKQCINELVGTSAEKKTVHGVRPIHITHDVVMLLDCRRSLNASIMTRHPLAPLEEHSRPRWFLERPRTCRHLQTAEDAGIAGNDLASCRLMQWEWMVLLRLCTLLTD